MIEKINIRKMQLNETLFKNKLRLTHIHLINNLINENKIDNLIYRITNPKALIYSCNGNKEYFDANEQFLVLLNNFISYFRTNFYFINTEFDYIIESLLKNSNPTFTKFLLSKNYIGNNDFINYYDYNLKRLITHNFYKNLKLLSKHSEFIKSFFKDKKLNININLINTTNGLERLFIYLKKLCVANVKNINLILLFDDINVYINDMKVKRPNVIEETIYYDVIKYYIREWEIIINNYIENKELIDYFFNN